jgi:hypothetical protein
MSINNILKCLLNFQKKIDIKKLPSQGLFYKEDFELFIKKADIGDIIEYEFNYNKESFTLIINKIKKIVENNTIFSNGYSFIDIKSIDVIFIFFEIVKLTKGKPISLEYFNDEIGVNDIIPFESNYFNYFEISDKLLNKYDSIGKMFTIDGYKFSLPTIGVESSLTNYLVEKQYESDADKYNDYNYDFTFFISDKNKLTYKEIDNLIHIFNFDIDEQERKKIRNIVKEFTPLQKYSLVKNNRVIDINSKIDLEKIWK